MVAHLNPGWIVLLFAWALLAFMGLRHFYLRRLAARIFGNHESDESALEQIRAVLEEVNRECRTHMFAAKRLTNTTFHDHPISLVDGWVIVPTAKGARTERTVLAIAHRAEADWLQRFSDVFELAYAGSAWSVFWVKLPSFVRSSNSR